MTIALLLTLTQFLVPVASAETAPSPRPKPASAVPAPKRPPRDPGVKTVPKQQTAPVVIHPLPPRATKKAPQQPTSFVLSKNAPGKLLLRFQSESPNWMLSTQASLAIQLNSPEGLEIEPSVITRKEWPKNSNELTLAYKSAKPGHEVLVQGMAAYTVCERKSKECRKTLSPLSLTFSP